MNRPFGAVDVSANLKGAVPKAATQKVLVALAEKGELTQKLYGVDVLLTSELPVRLTLFYLVLLRENNVLRRKPIQNGIHVCREASRSRA